MTEPTLTDFEDAPPPPRIGTDNDDQAPVNAPWGLRRDGTPARKPGRPAGSTTRRAARRARTTTSAPKPPKAAAPTKKTPNRRAPIRLLLKAGAYVCAFFSPLDAWTLTEYKEPLTELGNAYSEKIPFIGALLDRIAGIGETAEDSLILIPFLLQVAVNHGKLPAAMAQQLAPSVRSPEQIAAILQKEAEQQAAATAEGFPPYGNAA